jgi:hypothetical protein
MKNKLIILLFVFGFFSISLGQSKKYTIGTPYPNITSRTGGFYDYSDPQEVNIKVSVWGFVKYPGKYIIPVYSDVSDLLSYAGGPTEDAHLEDLRLYRILKDSTQVMYKFNWNDLLWNDSLYSNKFSMPKLQPGDILLVPGSRRLYFRDWFSMGLSLVSVLISLSILILNITRK